MKCRDGELGTIYSVVHLPSDVFYTLVVLYSDSCLFRDPMRQNLECYGYFIQHNNVCKGKKEMHAYTFFTEAYLKIQAN